MARITSAREIWDAGLASQQPPSGPRWLRTSPVRRNWVTMVSMNVPGILCARASCSTVTRLSPAAASSIAARSA